jgi:Ca-activated chloride channel family protein
MFAGILKNSPFMKQVTWNDASALATEAQNPQDAIQAEFITMIAKAKKIYGHRKRKKLLE